MTSRLPDWQARFGEVCEKYRDTPFEFGTHDCCLWASKVILAITGVDPGLDHRDYTDEKGALRTLQKFGGVGGVGDALGGPVVAPLMARVGDVGLVTIAGRESLGVCNGATWIGPGPTGLVAVPLRAATRAWRT